ncbi:MAG: hypothetical protein IT481_08670 [Gammaproteobacteria bacterium]|nr:hypothetical protein [Gammaproteobacteria bacterium]
MLLALAGCATPGDRPPAATRAATAAPIAAATFCEVMAAQGGAVRWSRQDTRETKERVDRLNAVWKRCPQYQPPVRLE